MEYKVLICEYCNKEYTIRKCKKRRFCSKECANADKVGKGKGQSGTDEYNNLSDCSRDHNLAKINRGFVDVLRDD